MFLGVDCVSFVNGPTVIVTTAAGSETKISFSVVAFGLVGANVVVGWRRIVGMSRSPLLCALTITVINKYINLTKCYQLACERRESLVNIASGK